MTPGENWEGGMRCPCGRDCGHVWVHVPYRGWQIRRSPFAANRESRIAARADDLAAAVITEALMFIYYLAVATALLTLAVYAATARGIDVSTGSGFASAALVAAVGTAIVGWYGTEPVAKKIRCRVVPALLRRLG